MSVNEVNPVKETNESIAQRKVFIFGAGLSGMSAWENLRKKHRILGFIDNNPAKHGKTFCELPIYSPAILNDAEFQLIYIASEYIESIQKQLLQECKVSPEKVHILPSYMTKPMQFGKHGDSEKAGELVLGWLCRILNQSNIHYFLDAGTLLGVLRDRALIPWDDDLDIGIPKAELDKVKQLLKDKLPDLQALTGITWHLSEIRSDKPYGAINVGDVRSLKLSCAQEEIVFPMVDLFVKYPNGDSADYALASRGISMPMEHFVTTEFIEFAGVTMKLPASPELYLERYYGDWRTPKKDWDVGMIKSASSF